MTTLTHELATDGQVKQLNRMATDAVEKAVKAYADANYLSKQGAERVKGSADFSARIHAATVLALTELSTNDKYKDEEVESTYGYLSGYEPKQLADQVTRLKELYPQLEGAEVADPGELPKGAEGWFAIPNIWKDNSPVPGTYNDNVVRVLDLIKQDRDGAFYNYRDGQLGPKHLRQSARTEATMRKLSEEQGHPDILVIAAQFGLTHRGRSVRRAREVMVDQGQYGLGSFAVGVMLLTHPERLQRYDDLWIDCAGDEFDDPVADGRFGRAPVFGFNDGGVKFGAFWADYADDRYGSASGVLPQ
jgi:hypothetical protein